MLADHEELQPGYVHPPSRACAYAYRLHVEVGTVRIGKGPDGGAFDDKLQLAFASCGEGVTTIAKEETPNKLTVVQTLMTERGAWTIALKPTIQHIYLPTAKFEPMPSPHRARRDSGGRSCRIHLSCSFTDQPDLRLTTGGFSAFLTTAG